MNPEKWKNLERMGLNFEQHWLSQLDQEEKSSNHLHTENRNSENINFKRRTLWVAILFHHIVCLCTPPQLCLCCYIILTPLHLCCVHIPKSILFISSTIVHLIHFIYHSPIHSFLLFIAHHFHIYHIWSYSCYIVIKPYFHDGLRNMILLKYIPSSADIKTNASKPDFIKITDLLLLNYSLFFNYPFVWHTKGQKESET